MICMINICNWFYHVTIDFPYQLIEYSSVIQLYFLQYYNLQIVLHSLHSFERNPFLLLNSYYYFEILGFWMENFMCCFFEAGSSRCCFFTIRYFLLIIHHLIFEFVLWTFCFVLVMILCLFYFFILCFLLLKINYLLICFLKYRYLIYHFNLLLYVIIALFNSILLYIIVFALCLISH